jgi:tripartite-type tricarboxylate transporter receptor subunit TctC
MQKMSAKKFQVALHAPLRNCAFAGELFKLMAGVDVPHVPYRGGAPALTDLLAEQVQV